MLYRMNGCRRTDGIQPMEEDEAIPKWPMHFEMSDRGYSPRLVIEAPEGVKLVCLNRKS